MAAKLTACRVAAVRVDTPWTTRGGVIACVASLTRPLSRQESRGMARFPEFSVMGDRVSYDCRPEESEEFEKRLSAVLRALPARGDGLTATLLGEDADDEGRTRRSG